MRSESAEIISVSGLLVVHILIKKTKKSQSHLSINVCSKMFEQFLLQKYEC